jgi:hypothetical protein
MGREIVPYIEKRRREAIEEQVFLGTYPVLENAGELNFFISIVLINYINDNGLRYQTLNDIVGALEGAKAEIQRKVVGPYEDQKASDNGDLQWPT